MPDAHARHAVVSDAGEPPSRYYQYSWLEALTTAFIDGDSSYLFLLFGSYTRFPFEILVLCHGIVFALMTWYGDALNVCLHDDSVISTTVAGMAALGSLFIQGVGYGIAEIVHTTLSKWTSAPKVYGNAVIAIFIKNGLLLLMTLYARTVVGGVPYVDLVEGALYAFVVLAIHEFAFGTPYLRKMVSYGALYSIMYSLCYESILGSSGYRSIFSYGVLCAMALSTIQEAIVRMPRAIEWIAELQSYAQLTIASVGSAIRHKPDAAVRFAGYIGLIFVGFLTSGAYAASVDVIVNFVPSIVVAVVALLGALEQALIYEYSYRITYVVHYYLRRIWRKQPEENSSISERISRVERKMRSIQCFF